MDIYVPYTYLIGWSNHNKWYYGVRYAKKCNPQDLWNTYFTSSNYVKDFREEYGEPDIIEIRKTFKNRDSAIIWEMKVIKRMNMTESNIWLNRSYGAGNLQTKGKLSKSHRNAISQANRKRVITEETRNKLRKNAISQHKKQDITGKNNPNYGNKWSDEKKKQLSEKLKGRSKGVKKSQETRNKISIAKKKYWQDKKIKGGCG